MLQEQPFWQAENLIPILTYSMGILIAVIYLCFLGVCLWRYFLLRKKNREKEQKERCSALIFAYLDGKKSREDIQSYLNTNASEIPLFVEVCIDLLRDLKGSLEHTVQELLTVSSIQTYYREKLNSRDLGTVADALLFYKYCPDIDQNTRQTITDLMDHENSELAFAAALAMINSKQIATQFTALEKICRRKDASRLAVLELMVIFAESESGDVNRKGEMMMQLIHDSSTTAGGRIVLVKSLGELRFVNQSAGLYSMLNKQITGAGPQQKAMTAALLEALGKLQYDGIVPHIEKLARPSGSEMLKVSCAKSLGALGGEKSIKLLDKLIDDPNENVRLEAMNQMLKIGQPVLNYLPDIRQVSYSKMEKQTLQELTEIKGLRYD